MWADVRHAAEIEVTKHGLRHAFATTARWLGYGDHVIARLLGHEMNASQTRRYGDVPEKQVQDAADKIAVYIADRLAASFPRLRRPEVRSPRRVVCTAASQRRQRNG